MHFLKNVEEKLERIKVIEQTLQDPQVSRDPNKLRDLGKELRELQQVKDNYLALQRVDQDLVEAKVMSAEGNQDEDMRQMALSEIQELNAKRNHTLKTLELLLVKKDPLLSKNAILEIRAGTGGAEASLFAAEIFRMYSRYAQAHGFKTEVLSQAMTEAGGVREVIFSVNGEGAFGRFKFESGTHRVQRVPVTEASGRIHTSACTVAVLPEAEEVEINIKPEEIKVDVFRSGGPGGQSVNTTDSAVRVTHVPTGLVVKCQDEKSQLKNKNKALKILRARLFDLYERESREKMAKTRKQQVGSGDRSEKIRTYNFQDRRVTDHRISLTLYSLEQIMEGQLDEFVDALHKAEAEKA